MNTDKTGTHIVTSNLDVVRGAYAAFERGDLTGVFATLDPDIEVYQSSKVPWGGTYRGHVEAQEFFMKLAATVDSKVGTERFLEAGDQIVQIGHTRGQARATGKRFEVLEVHVWTMRDGKVLRFEAYVDHPAMLAALR
jgi:ketosteroid isomerase-like protein